MLNTKQLFSFVLIAAAAWPVQNAVAQKIKPGTVAKVDTAVTKSVNKTINNTLKSTAKLSAAAKGVTPSAKHSVYPSQALNYVPSTKAPKATALNPKIPVMPSLDSVLIYGKERERYRVVREELQNISVKTPKEQSANISAYLRHAVPDETMRYMQQRYQKVLTLIDNNKQAVTAFFTYASLPGEGRVPNMQEKNALSTAMYNTLMAIRNLRADLPDDPFLAMQDEYWATAYEGFNPLLAGHIRTQTVMPRGDFRKFDHKEFDLMNPDGSDYVLPQASTMILDPDDLEEMDSYAYVRMRQQNPPITQENAALERTELLKQIPAGLRIAIINDDTLPLVNFKGWAEKGYLGEGATVDTFKNGLDFLDSMKYTQYDLVITDLLVPNGGKAMMKDLRLKDAHVPVIAMSKYDRGEAGEKDLFTHGMDGYLWYNNNVNEGAYGYIEVLRALKNYYYYKGLHNWIR
ncbi:response regulator [Candidatus Avelusimicrobium sp.]|uniref:response regulator n=1 Tax=Candidatus Avelusimicrobium sp. TaxID=3048833 RepID=UPI003D7D7541